MTSSPSTSLEPVLFDLIAPDLTSPELAAVAAWLLSKRSRHAREAYGRDLRRFIEFCDQVGERLATASASTVEMWATYQLETERAATASVARRCAAVSSFYQWAAKPGRLFEGGLNPASAELIDRVKASSVHTPALTLDEAQALIAAAKQRPRPGADARIDRFASSRTLRS